MKNLVHKILEISDPNIKAEWSKMLFTHISLLRKSYLKQKRGVYGEK